MFKPGDKIGPYTLVRLLGRGGFGFVWMAERHTVIATTRVAIKIPSTDEIDLEAVKREAGLWVQASGHPNILPIIEADIYDGCVVIASELALGGSLASWMRSHGHAAPSIKSALRMCLGILNGLEHLHAKHIIHRDIKPANVLLQGETPRLADFGISRLLRTTSYSANIAGTPVYMAPEAYKGKRTVQTDIWAVGVILYQLVSGRLPFSQEDLPSLFAAIQSDAPAPLPDSVHHPVQAIIERSLCKAPSGRYESAAAMRAAVETTLAGLESKQEPRPSFRGAEPDNSRTTQIPVQQDINSQSPRGKHRAGLMIKKNERAQTFFAYIGGVFLSWIVLLLSAVSVFHLLKTTIYGGTAPYLLNSSDSYRWMELLYTMVVLLVVVGIPSWAQWLILRKRMRISRYWGTFGFTSFNILWLIDIWQRTWGTKLMNTWIPGVGYISSLLQWYSIRKAVERAWLWPVATLVGDFLGWSIWLIVAIATNDWNDPDRTAIYTMCAVPVVAATQGLCLLVFRAKEVVS